MSKDDLEYSESEQKALDELMAELEELDELEDVDDVDLEEARARTSDLKENALEWYTGEKTITVTVSQKKLVRKLKILAEKYPDEVKIDVINPDGTVLAHIPLSYLRISRPVVRVLSEEERVLAANRLKEAREKRLSKQVSD